MKFPQTLMRFRISLLDCYAFLMEINISFFVKKIAEKSAAHEISDTAAEVF